MCIRDSPQPWCVRPIGAGWAQQGLELTPAFPSDRGAWAPPSIAVAGLACHPTANGRYELEPVPLNGRPHYTMTNGAPRLYWTPDYFGPAAWLLDTDTDDADADIDLISPSEAPPSGSAVWREHCGGAWTNAKLELTPAFPSKRGAWCEAALAALAPTLTATCCADGDGPGCGQNGQVPRECDVDCAHLWAPYAAQCPGESAGLGSAALQAFFGEECGAAARSLSLIHI